MCSVDEHFYSMSLIDYFAFLIGMTYVSLSRIGSMNAGKIFKPPESKYPDHMRNVVYPEMFGKNLIMGTSVQDNYIPTIHEYEDENLAAEDFIHDVNDEIDVILRDIEMP